MKNCLTYSIFSILLSTALLGQENNSINLGIHDESAYEIEYYQLKNADFRHIHSNIQPMTRNKALTIALAEETPDNVKAYLLAENSDSVASKRPFLRYFYRSPAYLFEYKSEGFTFKINPSANFEAGMQNTPSGTDFIYTNMRGAKLEGNISKKVYFYSDIYETQRLFPAYANEYFIDRFKAIPQAGFYKPFSSRLTNNAQDGYDYLLASGYISFDVAKYINIQFGNGRNFIGDGYRSLLLSNTSNNYTYLKINTHYKFLHYQNLFAEMVADHIPMANNRVPKKYYAAHYLSINILKNLNIGLFESIMYGNRGIELAYLNPIIFYRAIEQQLGSPDNAMVGMTFKYNFIKRFSLYGQFVLDEFVFKEMFIDRNGWWGNKYAVQLGLKYAEAFGVKGLRLQAEFNTVRPYTYTYMDAYSNFTHYNQPLAHILGANFREGIFRATYTGIDRLFVEAKFLYINQGLDTANLNYGSNLMASYIDRVSEYNNTIGQGASQKTFIFDLHAYYKLRHNLNIGLNYRYRKCNSEISAYNYNTQLFSVFLRYNFTAMSLDF